MVDRVVTKVLAGLEDLLFGRGTVNQSRAGGTYAITKLSLPLVLTDVADLATLDSSKFPFVAVVDTNQKLSFYEYKAGTGYVLAQMQNQQVKQRASFYLTASVSTPIIDIGVATKVRGTTAANAANVGFSHNSGRLTYLNTVDDVATVSASVQISGSCIAALSFYIAVNSVVLTDTKHYVPAGTGTQPRLASWSAVIPVSSSDKIEVYVANEDDLTDVLAESFNLTVSI